MTEAKDCPLERHRFSRKLDASVLTWTARVTVTEFHRRKRIKKNKISDVILK